MTRIGGAKRERGAIVIVAVVILLVFSAAAAMLGVLTTTGAISAANQSQSVQALYWAEWGVEWVARQAREQHENGQSAEETCDDLDVSGSPREFEIVEYRDACTFEIHGGFPTVGDPRALRIIVATINPGVIEGGGPPGGGPPGGGPPGGGPPGGGPPGGGPPGLGGDEPPGCGPSGGAPAKCDPQGGGENQPAIGWQEGGD